MQKENETVSNEQRKGKDAAQNGQTPPINSQEAGVEDTNPVEGTVQPPVKGADAVPQMKGNGSPAVEVRPNNYTPIGNDEAVANPRNIGMLMDVELPVSVELGRVRMLVKEILDLGPGAVVELNKISSEPVDIYLNQKKFAEGEVVVVDQNFGVRITALVGPDERLSLS